MAVCSRHMERYLVAAFRLSLASQRITVGSLAAALGVADSSASAMSGRLIDAGLLRRSARALALTAEGRRQGDRLLRRHRLVECLLADVLGLPAERLHEEASRLEEAFSDEVVTRLSEKLGAPSVCPHGLAIPAEQASFA